MLEEQNDEWAVGRRYFSSESMAKLTQPFTEEVIETLLALESAQYPVFAGSARMDLHQLTRRGRHQGG